MTNDDTRKDTTHDPAKDSEAGRPATSPAASEVELTDSLVSTPHTLRIGRTSLSYTATTGTVVLREESLKDGVWEGRKAKARVAITSYTLDGAEPHTRPVTFAFNGGPGSSSLWLHLGLLGPRRVLMGDVGELAPPPYDIADNKETLLKVSDLVFIDPVSTGISRAVEGEKPDPYHGYKGDIESVGEIIRQWTTREGRWLSPKFVAGESYGTTRAAALAEHLQARYGMYLNGLVLISSILDFGTADFEMHRNDRAFAAYLPFYAATAHFHGLHGRKSQKTVLDEAATYASRDYPWVLARGNRLTSAERAEAVATIARLTGLSEDYVDRADLRIEHWRYFGELLRDRRLTVGRLDSRFTGPAASAIAEHMDADPSMDAILGPFAAAFQHYLHAELGFTDDGPFRIITDAVNPWSFKEFEAKPVYVVDKLERAMRQNPHLRVHFAYGYYDGATPYSCAEETLAHLSLPPELIANIEHRYYPSGHMTYVHQPSRVQQSKDLADFVTASATPA